MWEWFKSASCIATEIHKKKKRAAEMCCQHFSVDMWLIVYVSWQRMTPFPPWEKCNYNNLVESLHDLQVKMVQNRKTRTPAPCQENFHRQLSSQLRVCHVLISGSALPLRIVVSCGLNASLVYMWQEIESITHSSSQNWPAVHQNIISMPLVVSLI